MEEYDRSPHRRLEVNLSFIFLSLFILSFIVVISFTHYRTSHSIIDTAKKDINLAGSLVEDKLSSLTQDIQEAAETTRDLVPTRESISPENPGLNNYLFSVLRIHKLIYSIYIGTDQGNFLEAINIPYTGRTTFLSEPSKPLPPNVVYALRWIDRTKPVPEETWVYKNAKLETVSQEKVANVKYDPRLRPWYIGAANSNAFFWTDVYTYDTLAGTGAKATGISIGDPLTDAKGNLFGVIGSDITLSILSDFLNNLKIEETGKAVILNSSGTIIVPFQNDQTKEPKWFSHEIVAEVFDIAAKGQKESFVFKNNGKRYIAYLKQFPVAAGNKWQVTIIVPEAELLASFLNTQKTVMIISCGILVLSMLLVYYFSRKTATPIVVLSNEVDKIRQFDLSSNVRIKTKITEIRRLDMAIAAMRSALRSFGYYVPKEIVRKLIEKGETISLGGEKKEVAIMFTDVVGFTSITETLDTKTFMDTLAEYFDQISRIILKYDGTIDKYIGDCVMAFWGAPLDVPNPCLAAALSALYTQAFLRDFNKKQIENRKPPFYTRIGIDFGLVIVGNIGTAERMNYTVIGDSVNVAARLEQLSKNYGTAILISEHVERRLEHQFFTRPVEHIAVRGKTQKVMIYELIGKKEGDPAITATADQIELCNKFTKAFEEFHSKDVADAKILFEELAAKYPDDALTKIYLEKCIASQTHHHPKNP